MKHKTLIPLNLQFFAADPATGGSTEGNEGSESNEGTNDSGNENGDQSQSSSGEESGEKTFTQAELSAVATAEKKQGKQSILNIFGVKDEKTAKEQAKALSIPEFRRFNIIESDIRNVT